MAKTYLTLPKNSVLENRLFVLTLIICKENDPRSMILILAQSIFCILALSGWGHLLIYQKSFPQLHFPFSVIFGRFIGRIIHDFYSYPCFMTLYPFKAVQYFQSDSLARITYFERFLVKKLKIHWLRLIHGYERQTEIQHQFSNTTHGLDLIEKAFEITTLCLQASGLG